MMKPRALDLFCGAGGATRGLQRAGFHVTGVDIVAQPNYCGDAFYQRDAFEAGLDYRDFDFVWASPPCQGRTAYKRRPNHVAPVDTDGGVARVRAMLERFDMMFVIENVPGAPLFNATLLCGSMFDETINVRRHRIFEPHGFIIPALPCRHERATGSFPQATNRANRRKTVEVGVWRIPLATQRAAMGIDWMELDELSESIPPAYAEYIGDCAIAEMEAEAQRSCRI